MRSSTGSASPSRRRMPPNAAAGADQVPHRSAGRRSGPGRSCACTSSPSIRITRMIWSIRSCPTKSSRIRSSDDGRAASAVKVGRRGIKPQRQVADVARHQVSLRRAIHAQGDVSLAEQQVLGRVRRDEVDLDARFLGAEAGEDRWQHVMRHDTAGGDADRALDACWHGPWRSAPDQPLRPAHRAGGGKQRLPGLGQCLALRGAGEERHLQARPRSPGCGGQGWAG